jgi:SAM-dependent methyltransferase
VEDQCVEFDVGDAMSLPYDDEKFDAAVSGLVLNFLPDPATAIQGMARVTACLDGMLGAYVWDYASKMEMIRYFFDAAVALDPDAATIDEGPRFTVCDPDRLGELFQSAGLRKVETCAIDVPTRFRNFDDYWTPFLAGTGVAPAYVISLARAKQAALRERLRETLPIAQDGSISRIARAWAVKGTV